MDIFAKVVYVRGMLPDLSRFSACLFLASALFGQQFQIVPETTAAPDALVFAHPVADFETQDLSGRTWRSADLVGKTTLVQIWARLYLPCRQELPALQAFYNEVRSSGKVQVLTFSVDADASRTASFMTNNGYTFPVIVNADLASRLFPAGLPESWVIGPNGRRTDRFKTWTFGRILLELEKTAR